MVETVSCDVKMETEPKLEEVRLLEDRIYEFNVQATGISDGKLFALFSRDDDRNAVGGIFGWTWGATCYLRSLYVPEPLRKQGLGSALCARSRRRRRRADVNKSCWRRTSFKRPTFTVGLASKSLGASTDIRGATNISRW